MPCRFNEPYSLQAVFYSLEDRGDGSPQPRVGHVLFASKDRVIASKFRGPIVEKWGKMIEPVHVKFVKDMQALIAKRLRLTGRLPEIRIVNLGFDAGGQIVNDVMTPANPHIGGCYDRKTHTILLNRPILRDPFHATKIVAHELRHVYQVEQVEAWQAGRSHDPQAVVWAPEVARPVDPVKDRRGYWNMVIEVDARAYEDEIFQLIQK